MKQQRAQKLRRPETGRQSDREPGDNQDAHAVKYVASILDRKRHVSHRPLAGQRRGIGIKALTSERVLTMSAVRLYLVTKIGVVTRTTEEVHQAAKERAHERHVSCPVAGGTQVEASTRWIALTIRSNSACSAVSCLRPAAVSV